MRKNITTNDQFGIGTQTGQSVVEMFSAYGVAFTALYELRLILRTWFEALERALPANAGVAGACHSGLKRLVTNTHLSRVPDGNSPDMGDSAPGRIGLTAS